MSLGLLQVLRIPIGLLTLHWDSLFPEALLPLFLHLAVEDVCNLLAEPYRQQDQHQCKHHPSDYLKEYQLLLALVSCTSSHPRIRLKRIPFDYRQLISAPLSTRKSDGDIALAIRNAVQVSLDEIRPKVDSLCVYPAPSLGLILQSALRNYCALPLRKLFLHNHYLKIHNRVTMCGLVQIKNVPILSVLLRIDFHKQTLVVGGLLIDLEGEGRLGSQQRVLGRNHHNPQQCNDRANHDYYEHSSEKQSKQYSSLSIQIISMSEELICPRHKQLISFVCTFENCANRKMCEQCRLRENLHISQHTNFIYRLKEFYDYSGSKDMVPRLEKGIQDSENFINSHKSFYNEQSRLLNLDFELLTEVFREVSERYKKIYVEAFEKEMTMFDEELMAIKTLLKEYAYEKNQQESFFTRIFGNDSVEKQQIDDVVKKNTKAFKVRAAIISLRSKIVLAKTNKTSYKATPTYQARYEELKDHFKQFTINFFDRLKELLSHQGSPTTLKNSIVSQSRALSGSQVGQQSLNGSLSGSQVSISSQPANLTGSVNLSSSRSHSSTENSPNSCISLNQSRIRVALPEPHPQVLNIIKLLKPIEYPPNLPMLANIREKGKRDQGPFRYSLGTYYGTYENGVRSGKGIFIFARDGSFYDGTWEDDNMCGYGRLITQNSYYQGAISNGVAHGTGTFDNSLKSYSGEWRNDQRHGRGEQVYKTKRLRYKGTFSNDKYHGHGVLQEQEFTYSGQFSEGIFEGQGTIRYKSGDTFIGLFRSGQKVRGRHQMPQGSYYEGQYEADLPHGKGEFRWFDGVRYIGQWKYGVQDGEGIEIRDGKELRGLWKGGNWIRWI